ncbi:MAG: DUF3488 and DUF4129 domain-containing transglutaminase family protein [Rubripirellula sp.]
MTNIGLSSSSPRIARRLKLYFAMLSCLGGMVLTAGNDTYSIPVIAVFFTIFGYLFVDVLELFALPAIAAYAAMAMAALYCVSDFADLNAPGNHQMVAVAQLLVFVQAILMLQRKSRRIFEQLGVFCLLELIVAAVFNNAINYGLLLIPIGIIGAWALSLLAALSASEGLEPIEGLESSDEGAGLFGRAKHSTSITTSAPDSMESMASAALRLPRVAMLTLAPSVLLVGAIFFYALPRTTDAARAGNRGNALVGFSEQLFLAQLGELSQSSEAALRLQVRDRATDQPYQVFGGIYLRGRVLDAYRARFSGDRNDATWTDTTPSALAVPQRLPREYFPERNTDENFYEPVSVSVTCESMNSSSLFSVAPYYQIKHNPAVVHFGNSWTLARKKKDGWIYPRLEYEFGTHAFNKGIQSDLQAHWMPTDESVSESAAKSDATARIRMAGISEDVDNYIEKLLDFDPDSMPMIAATAKSLAESVPLGDKSDYQVAKVMERYLATSRDFQYTLNLDSQSVPGVDPIEQFVTLDKKGHCQYFASALAMMLRSQKIPSRVVVGYFTDEYNELDRRYVARQLHAHAWVEALIDREELGSNRNIYGQPVSEQYWLRLDPTPSNGSLRETRGSVGQVLDLAQTMWDDYVVEMDSSRQDSRLIGGGVAPISGSYERMVDWLSLAISRIRAGELGGGSLAGRDLFSWPAAVLGVGLALLALVLMKVRTPEWLRKRIQRGRGDPVAQPKIAFYQETLQQLARVGIHREASQTPVELADDASLQLDHPMIPSVRTPLETLTNTFYRLRFGSVENRGDLEMGGPIEHARQRSREVDDALLELKHSVDLMTVNSNKVDSTK